MRILMAAAVMILGQGARAEVPNVVADIAPVHGLVSMVMDGVGSPALLLEANVSPHHAALKPSQAGVLSNADLVIWMGPDLSPQLETIIGSLAGAAEKLVLQDVEDTVLLEIRTAALFDTHGHDAHEGHGDHADHDDHADHEDHADHDDHKDHEDHAHEAEADHEGHDHTHTGHDPHSWLSPENAALWLVEIAEQLSRLDPDNAQTYRDNARAGAARIADASERISAQLADLRDAPYVSLHDATQYFAAAFGLRAAGSIAASDAATPGPARLSAMRDAIKAQGISCVLSEPQPGDQLVRIVTEGQDVTLGIVDPLGAGIAPGKDLYVTLLENMAAALTTCLTPKG